MRWTMSQSNSVAITKRAYLKSRAFASLIFHPEMHLERLGRDPPELSRQLPVENVLPHVRPSQRVPDVDVAVDPVELVVGQRADGRAMIMTQAR